MTEVHGWLCEGMDILTMTRVSESAYGSNLFKLYILKTCSLFITCQLYLNKHFLEKSKNK